jgi:CheY-like chemotaxis protein
MCKVLVIDDSKLVVKKIEDTLSGHFDCKVFTDAEEGIAFAQEFEPNIVLLDIEMPGVDGYEACKKIKSNPQLQGSFVIFISGHIDFDSKIRAYDVGGYDFIAKPFSDEEVLRKVRNIALMVKELTTLKQSEDETKSLAMTSMKQASQYSYIMNFFKNLNHCHTVEDSVALFFSAMSYFNLRSSLLLEMENTLYFSSPELAMVSPIEVDLYQALRPRGRLYEFRNRLMVNDKHVSFLVKNMPEDDNEAGEIRDVVAAIIEGLEAKVIDLKRQAGLEMVTEELKETVEKVNSGINTHHTLISSVITDMIGEMAASFHSLELTEIQESFFADLFENAGEKIMSVEEVLVEVQQQLTLLSQHVDVIIEDTQTDEVAPSVSDDDIELF